MALPTRTHRCRREISRRPRHRGCFCRGPGSQAKDSAIPVLESSRTSGTASTPYPLPQPHIATHQQPVAILVAAVLLQNLIAGPDAIP